MKVPGLLFLTLLMAGCAWYPLSSSKIVFSLDEGRSLTTQNALPFGLGDKLVLRVASPDGLTLYQEKIYTAPSSNYSLEADNLSEGSTYRAIAFYEDGNNQVVYMDTRQVFLLGETQTVTLKLGHAAKIVLNSPSYNLNFANLKPYEFKFVGNSHPTDSNGAKIHFSYAPTHHPTLTSYQYRVNSGSWITQSTVLVPVLNFPQLGLYVVQIRYQQESNGEWLLYTFYITRQN